eukprot:508518-Hanusia_phi.AAC.3
MMIIPGRSGPGHGSPPQVPVTQGARSCRAVPGPTVVTRVLRTVSTGVRYDPIMIRRVTASHGPESAAGTRPRRRAPDISANLIPPTAPHPRARPGAQCAAIEPRGAREDEDEEEERRARREKEGRSLKKTT